MAPPRRLRVAPALLSLLPPELCAAADGVEERDVLRLLTLAGLLEAVREGEEGEAHGEGGQGGRREVLRRRWLLGLEHVRTGAVLESDPWGDLAIHKLPTEYCRRFDYDPATQMWTVTETLLKVEAAPFAEGAMRECFRMKKMTQRIVSQFFQQDWERASNYVMKRYKDPPGAPKLSRKDDRARYFDDVQMQMDAKLLGQLFTNERKPPKKVDFLHCFVVELPQRPGKPTFAVERFMAGGGEGGDGGYRKYNSNAGMVEHESLGGGSSSFTEASGARAVTRATPQAFTHFTFERTGGRKMCVDIQGIDDLYTDPQIHTLDGIGYGSGNLGVAGMALFFSTHHFTPLSADLGLRRFELSPALADRAARHHFAGSGMAAVLAEAQNRDDDDGFWAKQRDRLGDALGKGAGASAKAAGATVAKRVPCKAQIPRPTSVRDMAAALDDAPANKNAQVSLVDTAMRSFSRLWAGLLGQDGVDTTEAAELDPAPLAALPPWAKADAAASGDARWAQWRDASSRVRARRLRSRAASEVTQYDVLSRDLDAIETDLAFSAARVHEELARRCAIGMLPATEADPQGEAGAVVRPPPDACSSLWHAAYAARGGASAMACRSFRNLMRGVPQDTFPGLTVMLAGQNDKLDGLDAVLGELSAAAGDPEAMLEIARARLAGGDANAALDWLEEVEATRSDWQKRLAVVAQSKAEAEDEGLSTELLDPTDELARPSFWEDVGGPGKGAVLALMAECHLQKTPKDASAAGDCYTEASEAAMAEGKTKLGMQLMEKAEAAYGEMEEE